MQITTNPYIQNSDTALERFSNDTMNNTQSSQTQEELSIEQQMEKSAVQVSISMNAQIILFVTDSKEMITDNTDAQKNILSFLSGEEIEGQLSLKDLGYDGKPITELSEEEAKELISDDGFFGVENTSQRVADFVFSFAGDDLDILQQGRDGIVQGFEDAKQMWGDDLPEISYETQEKTLALIDERIAQLTQENI
ncbi:MAG: hydrogenase-4 component G [Campylobacterota bacterium]|nr:hydrogenase-4 component G [Campylobacterota bacterium]